MTIATDDVDIDRDSRLVQQCQAGRSEAFDELYRLYHDRIVRHCARRLGNHANAEDVAQETFIRAWRAIDRFEGRRRFYPWLHVIASNACTDVLRRERPTSSLSEVGATAEFDTRPGTEDLFITSVDAGIAAEAMQMLNERHRRVLHLREELEWSVQDIAAHEGLEPNAIDSRLWRARAALRQKFDRLSQGVAAMFATGTGFLSIRHRVARAVHMFHGAGGVSLPARAAVAAVVVLGVGASSASLLTPPPAPRQPVVARHPVTGTSAVEPPGATAAGRTGSSVVPSANARPGGGAGAVTPTSPTGSPAQSTVPSGGTSSVPGSASSSAPLPVSSGASDLPANSPLAALPVVGAATSGVASTVGGVSKTAVGVVNGVGGAVTGAVGGVVKTTVANPVLAPVLKPVAPVLKPVTGGGGGLTLP